MNRNIDIDERWKAIISAVVVILVDDLVAVGATVLAVSNRLELDIQILQLALHELRKHLVRFVDVVHWKQSDVRRNDAHETVVIILLNLNNLHC